MRRVTDAQLGAAAPRDKMTTVCMHAQRDNATSPPFIHLRKNHPATDAALLVQGKPSKEKSRWRGDFGRRHVSPGWPVTLAFKTLARHANTQDGLWGGWC